MHGCAQDFLRGRQHAPGSIRIRTRFLLPAQHTTRLCRFPPLLSRLTASFTPRFPRPCCLGTETKWAVRITRRVFLLLSVSVIPETSSRLSSPIKQSLGLSWGRLLEAPERGTRGGTWKTPFPSVSTFLQEEPLRRELET